MLPVTTRHIGGYSGVKRIVCSTNQIQIPWGHCRHQHDNFQVPSISENKDGHTYRYWPLAGETTRGDWCVHHEGELWCANAFYLFDAQNVALYLLTDDKTRHAQMSGACAPVAGTVNGQPKTVARIRGVQFKGKFAVWRGRRATPRVKLTFVASRSPVLPAPVWEIRLDEIKFTDNTLGFGKNCTGYVTHAPSRRSASRLNAGRSSGVRLVTS